MGAERTALGAAEPLTDVGEWTVLRGLRWPGRWFPSVVRVLVGPGGLFVIAAHPTTAEVTVVDDRVRLGGRPDDQSVSDVTDAALVVAQHAGPYAAQVQPVLCFTSTTVPSSWAGDVLCASVHELVGWLSTHPAVLGPREIDDVTTRIRVALRAEVDEGPAPRSSRAGVSAAAPVPVQRASGSTTPVPGLPPARPWSGARGLGPGLSAAGSGFSRRILRGGLAMKGALLAVVTLAMLAYGPGALNPVGDAVGRWFSDATTPAACPAAGPAAGTSSGLPGAPAAGVPSPSPLSRADATLRIAQAQLQREWTPGTQAVQQAAHPLCGPSR